MSSHELIDHLLSYSAQGQFTDGETYCGMSVASPGSVKKKKKRRRVNIHVSQYIQDFVLSIRSLKLNFAHRCG